MTEVTHIRTDGDANIISMKTTPTKDEILALLRRLESQHAPAKIGQGQFEKVTGISRYQWQQATELIRWSDVREAAGLDALPWSPRQDKEALIDAISAEIKRTGKVPVWQEIRLLRRKNTALPSISTLRKWFRTKVAFLKALMTHAEVKPEYQGNLAVLRAAIDSTPVPELLVPSPHPGISFARRSEGISDEFVPPVIRCLPLLASGDVRLKSELEAAGKTLEREMERRSAIALRLLGLDVEEKARPGKEEADGVALGRSGLDSWGLIYDAKTKENGASYRLSVDERRKFESYIRLHSPKLTDRGCRRVHLAIIANSFEEKDAQVAQDIRLAAGQAAQSVCLLTAAGLVGLVDQKLRGIINGEQVERILATTSIVK
jgi:hypothetical protein